MKLSYQGDLLKRLWGSFSARVFICLMLCMVFLIVLIESFLLQAQRRTITENMIKEGRTMATLLADSVRLGVFSENMEMVLAPVTAILKQDNVLEVLVFDDQGTQMLDRRRRGFSGDSNCLDVPALEEGFSGIRQSRSVRHHMTDDCLLFLAPVQTPVAKGGEEMFFDAEGGSDRDKEFLGIAAVVFDRQIFEKQLSRLMAGNLLLVGLSLLFAAIATYLIVQAATRPLNRLVRNVRKTEFQPKSADEIGLLHESFSSMVERLSESFETINRLKSELEEMTREVLRTQEQERQRLALDLHDNVAQELSALKIFCAGLTKECSDSSQTVNDRIKFISESLKKCIQIVRELSYDLRPPGLTQLGLAQTVLQLCNEFEESTGTEVDILITGFDGFEPDYNIAINCYRIIQEALSNVKKHAKAKLVQIRLIESFPRIILRIRDDGVGFDMETRKVETLHERRMGLRNIEKRASLLNGTATIESSPGKGTKIIVDLPYDEQSEKRKIADSH